MASKRSKVQPLQRVAPATAVARPVDTFVQYRPPARSPNSGTALLKALAEVSPQIAKIAQSNREERVAKEKSAVDNAFFNDPEQFAKDVAAGKYSSLSQPAQILADENIGKRLSRQYGAYVNEQYTAQGIGNSVNANDFMVFEQQARQQFVANNKDAFSSPSVTRGFAGSFRTYLQNLDASHISNVNKNIVARDTATYTTGLTERIDAVINGTVAPEDFASEIGFVETDTKLTSALSNAELTDITLNTIVDYAQNAEGYNFYQRNRILDLAGSIQAGNQALSQRPQAIIALGKARVAILKQKQAQESLEETEFQRDKRKVTDMITATIVEQLGTATDPNDVGLSDILSIQQIDEKEAAIYFPNIRKFYKEQQNFFSKESREVEGSDIIAMRGQITSARTPEEALRMLFGFQMSGKLNNNPDVFNTLFMDVNRKREQKAKGIPSITSDDNYKLNYNKLKTNLAIKIDANGDIETSDALINLMDRRPDTTAGDRAKMVKVTFPIRAKYHNQFLDEMQDLYLSDEYQLMSASDKSKAVRTLYKTIIDAFTEEIEALNS